MNEADPPVVDVEDRVLSEPICQSHWDKLKAAIEERGMADLISPDGASAVRNMTEMQTNPSPATFDPLIAAFTKIMENAIGRSGMGVLAPEIGCVICYLEAEHIAKHEREGTPSCGASYEEWVTLAADGAKTSWETILARGTPDA